MSVPSIRNATRTWARNSSRFSPRIPVETMSTARMLRSDDCAWVSACLAASSVDVFELPTSSMILTTATVPPPRGWRGRVLSRRVPPCRAADLAGRDPVLQRGPQPGAHGLALLRGRGGFGQELLERGDDRCGLGCRCGRRDELDLRTRRFA